MRTLLEGLELISSGKALTFVGTNDAVNKAGDPTFVLEKFLLEWTEIKAPHLHDQALLVLGKPSKLRLASYVITQLRAAVER